MNGIVGDLSGNVERPSVAGLRPTTTGSGQPTRAGRIFRERTLSESAQLCALNQDASMHRNKETRGKFEGFTAGGDSGRPNAEQTAFANDAQRSQPTFPAPYHHSRRACSALEQGLRLRCTTRRRGLASGR